METLVPRLLESLRAAPNGGRRAHLLYAKHVRQRCDVRHPSTIGCTIVLASGLSTHFTSIAEGTGVGQATTRRSQRQINCQGWISSSHKQCTASGEPRPASGSAAHRPGRDAVLCSIEIARRRGR